MSTVDQLRQAAAARRAEVFARLDTSPAAMQTPLDKVLVRAATSGTTGIGAAVLPPRPSPSNSSQPGRSSGPGAGPWIAGVVVVLGGALLAAAVLTSTSADVSDTATAADDVNVLATVAAVPVVAPSSPELTSDPAVTEDAVAEVAVTVDATTVAPPDEEADTPDTTTIPAPVLIPVEADASGGSTTSGTTTGGTTGGTVTGGDVTGTDTGADIDTGPGGTTAGDAASGSDSSSTAGLEDGTAGDSGGDSGNGSNGDAGSESGGDVTGADTAGADTTGGDPPPPPPPSSTCGSTAGLPVGAAAVIAGAGDFDGDGDADDVGLYNTASGVAVVVDRTGVGLSDIGFIGEKPVGDLSGTAFVRGVRTEGAEIDFGIVIDDLDDDGSTVWLRPFAVVDCDVTVLELPREPGEPGGELWGGSGYSDDGVDFGLQCLTEGEVTLVTFLSDFEVGALVAFAPSESSLSFVDDAAATNPGCWQ